jgi:hypothetical protein
MIFAESSAELQATLNAMFLHSETWKPTVNTSKTYIVIFFSKSRCTENTNFTYNNKKLTMQMIFNTLVRRVIFISAQQTRKAMFSLLRKDRKLWLPVDILLQLFDATVVPILLYDSVVWEYENNKIIESLHLEFCKYIIKVNK